MAAIRRGAVALFVALASASSARAQTGTSAAGAPDLAAATRTASQGAGAQAGEEGRLQRMQQWVRDTQLVERLNGDVDGWYPRIGGITRGSGFAGGPGLRGAIPGTPIYLDLSAAVSTKRYKAFDVRARWLQAAGKRIELWTEFRYEDFPQEDFFGTGMSTTPAMRTSYDFDDADVRLHAVLKPRPWVRFDATVGSMRPDIGSGTDGLYPSIEDRFTDAQAPGLLEQPAFLRTVVSAQIDYRDTGGNTTSGGFYRASYGRWNDVTLDQYDFQRLDVQAVQFVPLVPSRAHVVSGRIGASYVNNTPGDRVPFYFLAYVGGMDTIRSFREFRFKDENALWVSAEYKWRPMAAMSVAVFADAGEAHPDWEDVDLRGMRSGYGAGVGFHSKSQTLLRVDVGTGAHEGWRLFIKIRPLF